jgi:hypothetical protein
LALHSRSSRDASQKRLLDHLAISTLIHSRRVQVRKFYFLEPRINTSELPLV